jgi:integrase/recombinase XerD
MNSLQASLERYLKVRRSMGFKLERDEWALRNFVSFLSRERAPRVTTSLALRWAKLPKDAKPVYWSNRLTIIRGFAKFLMAADPRTEVPPGGLLPSPARRQTPHIFSEAEKTRLIRATQQLRVSKGAWCQTYSTLLGLLASTGLRVGEARNLDREDVDLENGLLTIRKTKFGKSRLVPLHPTTREALRRYSNLRDKVFHVPHGPSFFVGAHGGRLNAVTVRLVFVRLMRTAGFRAGPGRRPRLHDFRHSFAVEVMKEWYRKGRDVEQLVPSLSTYLGHASVKDTYWYLTGVPELMALVSRRLEKALGGLS